MHNAFIERRKMIANNNTINYTRKQSLYWNNGTYDKSTGPHREPSTRVDGRRTQSFQSFWIEQRQSQMQTGQVSEAKRKILRAKAFHIWSPNKDLTKCHNTMVQGDAWWVCHKNNHFSEHWVVINFPFCFLLHYCAIFLIIKKISIFKKDMCHFWSLKQYG